ncbi:MAG: hypothetical protein K0B11_00600 [Mariniphaga sp.]|nr:hypothetical protein [Mariniphaga sp.]
MNGLKNIQPKNTIDIMPYVVARTERFEKEPKNPFRKNGKDNGLNAGLDAKIGLTHYLTLDVTINPDFGQVEADPSEVNLTTYETFFEEKRPFFIEGKNILKYKLMFGDGDLAYDGLFYSRRIGRRPYYSPDLEDNEYARVPEFSRILGAAKITGKTKSGWSVGVLESITGEEHAEIKGIGNSREQTVDPFTNYFVSRVQKDFNVKEFLSNMVVRWEYQPGSTVFLVWSQTRSDFKNDGSFDFSRDFEGLFNEKPHNIFLLKFSYRFGR